MIKSRAMGKGKRPNPTIFEILAMDDKVLHEFWDQYKESISHAIKINKSIEDDHASALLWTSLCARFHRLKECEERMHQFQAKRKRILQLKEQLRVDEDEALAAPKFFYSQKFSVLSEQEIEPRKQLRKKPTTKELNGESDHMLQYLWNAFKGSISEVKKNNLSPSKDHKSSLLLKCVHQRYYNLKNHKEETQATTKRGKEKSENKEPVSYIFSGLGEGDSEPTLVKPLEV